MFIYCSKLIDTFFRTGFFVFPNIFYFFASVGVSGFHMSLILLHNVISIMLFIECQLNLFKRKIILFSLIFHCGISLIAVPVNILSDSFIVDMLTVFWIESPIIMKRIVNSIFPRSAVMPCSFHFTFLLAFFQVVSRRDCSEAA